MSDELAALARAGAAVAALEAAANGHSRGTAPAGGRTIRGVSQRPKDAQSSVLPRLLTMRQAGQYLAVSYWTVRTWVEHGTLRAVRLPGGGKLLRIDRAALDALIEACREG